MRHSVFQSLRLLETSPLKRNKTHVFQMRGRLRLNVCICHAPPFSPLPHRRGADTQAKLTALRAELVQLNQAAPPAADASLRLVVR
jgi:hypothetical protein